MRDPGRYDRAFSWDRQYTFLSGQERCLSSRRQGWLKLGLCRFQDTVLRPVVTRRPGCGGRNKCFFIIFFLALYISFFCPRSLSLDLPALAAVSIRLLEGSIYGRKLYAQRSPHCQPLQDPLASEVAPKRSIIEWRKGIAEAVWQNNKSFPCFWLALTSCSLVYLRLNQSPKAVKYNQFSKSKLRKTFPTWQGSALQWCKFTSYLCPSRTSVHRVAGDGRPGWIRRPPQLEVGLGLVNGTHRDLKRIVRDRFNFVLLL